MDIKKELDAVQKKIDEIKKVRKPSRKSLTYRKNGTKKWGNDHIVVVMR